MFEENQHTIYALASGKGRAGVAVVRLSGSACRVIFSKLSRQTLPSNRMSALRSLYDPETNLKIDEALVLWFEGPNSFTGEDVLEFQVHGGPAVLKSLDNALLSINGVRLAEPGEFSRRAFENNKLDLTAIEGLNDLIWAETEAQKALALRQMSGELGKLYEMWRAQLISCLAHLEADIAFPDEDLPDGFVEEVRPKIAALYNKIQAHLNDQGRGERIRRGLSVVIVGPPNIGKSSFFNYLAKEEIAIVSDLAGTTRDIIEIRMDIGGYPVTFFDTAGLRETNNPIEREGVKRARAKADNANIKIILSDSQLWPNLSSGVLELIDANSILALNKSDLLENHSHETAPHIECPYFFLSSTKGDGFEKLLVFLESKIISMLEIGDAPNLTRNRHRVALEDCQNALLRFLERPSDPALRVEDVRLAIRSIGKITGRVDVEDILDLVFSEFCIGK